ncbi:MAG: flavin reductase family protein [Candidatus Thermoplasmatota archaeon]
MKKRGEIKKFYHYSFPMQAALVTCKKPNDGVNAITVAWHTPLSKKPPLYGVSIAPSRYSHGLIEKSREFVVNFVPFKLVDKLQFCGSRTGRKTDKIKETGLTLDESEYSDTAFIKEAYSHLECKLYDSKKVGDHTFFIGEVLNVMYEENSFKQNLINLEQVEPSFYRGGKTYTSCKKDIKKF